MRPQCARECYWKDMRRALLLSAAAVLMAVPGVGAVSTAFFPRQDRILPVGFWALWLLVSLWTMFYAPIAVDRLTQPHGSSHQCATYAKWGIALGMINIAWSVVEILLLG